MNKEPTFSTQKQEHTMYEQGTLHFLHRSKSILLCMNKEPTFSTQKQEHTMYEQGTYIFYTKTRAYYV